MTNNTARLIDTAMKALGGRKTQAEVAKAAGFPRPNMLSMVKSGKARLPLERVPALAEALEIDAALLFRLVLAQNWPGYERVVIRIFGAVLTDEERNMILFIRHVTGGKVPQLNRRSELSRVRLSRGLRSRRKVECKQGMDGIHSPDWACLTTTEYLAWQWSPNRCQRLNLSPVHRKTAVNLSLEL